MTINLDQYTLRARVVPALILVLPAALTVLAWVPTGWGFLTSALTEAGGAILLASLTRHAGRNKQQKLFELWRGRPSDRMLSHQHAPNPVTLRRRHEQLRALLPDIHIPTEEEETQDPNRARQVYETCIEFLRGKTRNHDRFPLVFEENCDYGFARNLWAVKPWGLLIAGGACITLGGQLLELFAMHQPVTMPLVVLTGANFVILLLWIFRFTPDWVKGPADAYAKSVLEALDELSSHA